MGNTYFLYLEARVKERDGVERWKCVNGFYKEIPYGKTEEELHLSHLVVNGSRSYFGRAYEKLQEIGTMTLFTELSREIREEHPELKHVYEYWTDKETDETARYVTVPLRAFEAAVPKGFQYHGVYHKDAVARFERGESEELWEDDEVDFSKMDPLAKQCWTYKEWDDPMGWEKRFKEIAEAIRRVRDQYVTDTWDFDEHEMRIVAFRL